MIFWRVRRWAASLLLVLTALLPLQPLLARLQAAGGIPACCRRNGVHHCMMKQMMVQADSAAHAIVSTPPCPWWKLAVPPAVVATTGSLSDVASQPATVGNVAFVSPSLSLARFARSLSTRAPPAFNL